MYDTVHSRGHIQGFLKILYGGQIKGENGGGKRDETFFSAFILHTPIHIVFLNNF